MVIVAFQWLVSSVSPELGGQVSGVCPQSAMPPAKRQASTSAGPPARSKPKSNPKATAKASAVASPVATPTKGATSPAPGASPDAKENAKSWMDSIDPKSFHHPTLVKLAEGLCHDKVKAFVREVHECSVIPLGGLREFSLDEYRSSMKLCGTFSFLTLVTDLDPLQTAHSGLIPSWSSVTKCEETCWTSSHPRIDSEGRGFDADRRCCFLTLKVMAEHVCCGNSM